MVNQQTFDFAAPVAETGARLRARGMQRAERTAERFEPGWPDRAYGHLQVFLSRQAQGTEFMTEDVRQAAYRGGLETPPSERAWGSVVNRAVRAGLIERAGTRQVTNPKAHRAYASVWVVSSCD